MRKIYSLVLMATMLLVGTNAWADVHATLVDGVDEAKVTKDGGSTWRYATSLKDAFDYVGYGETAEIVLLRSINVEAPITMPGTIPTYANGKGRLHEVVGQNITLNLNGNNITTTTNNVTPFRILKGSLDIEGSGIITKEHTNRYKVNGVEKVSGEPDWYGGAIVAISGAQDSLAADWSVLTIGKDVTLQFNRETDSDGKVLKSKAIAITNFAGLGWAKTANYGTANTQGEGTDFLARKYNALGTETSAVSVINASEQVDKFGYATRATKPTSPYKIGTTTYTQAIWQGNEDDHGTVEQIASAIAANKNFLPMGWGVLSGTNTFNKNTENETIYYYNILQGCAFGVKVIIEGTVSGSYYGVHFHGNINQTPEGLGETKTRHEAAAPYFTHQFPYLKVGKTATVSSAADGSCNGIYVAGYGVVDIEGEVYGATGVYMKSGDVVCKDANIRSTFTGDAVFNWGTNGDGGTHGAGGSAIVAETSDAYAGGMGVTIQGDTKVTGSTGYAIFDQTTVTTTTEGDVTTYSTTNHVTIEGGTIESGTLGTIAVTQGAVDATSIAGGNVEGTTVTISNPDNPGQTVTIPTTDFIQPGTHTTTVTDGNKTIIVVSEGAAPTGQDNVAGHEGTAVNWKHTANPDPGTAMSETLTSNLTLTELEINQSYNQILTVGDPGNVDPNKRNITLTVGRVVLGENAQIIVNPGSKLIVTGEQGIVAPSEDNIKLVTSETEQAVFLFNPDVTSNKHPKATVEYASRGKFVNPEKRYNWQRFCIPTEELPKAKLTDNSAEKERYNPSNPIFTQIYQWDYDGNAWLRIDEGDYKLERFRMYNMTNSSKNGDVTYQFKGGLCGNVNDNLDFVMGYNFFGNSYNAPMDVETLLLSLTDARISHTIYLWDVAKQRYQDYPLDQVGTILWLGANQIPSMQTFVFQQISAGDVNVAVNYKNLVWDTRNKVYAAPSRQNTNFDAFRIHVSDANNHTDQVTFVIDGNYSASFDNGGDANKLLANDMINIYAMTDNGIQSTVASDNVLGTMLSLQTKDEESYMITFSNVTTAAYALRDTQTGAIVNIVDGGVYCFTTFANSTIDNRFEIVARQEMPTDVETIENAEMKNGSIYTITGQYVGEVDSWFALPAGMYIMNGQKVIK